MDPRVLKLVGLIEILMRFHGWRVRCANLSSHPIIAKDLHNVEPRHEKIRSRNSWSIFVIIVTSMIISLLFYMMDITGLLSQDQLTRFVETLRLFVAE